MKNKKGFTLIELLAVIVVLGIIMLIAVTSVSGVLEKSRKDSFVATARAYINAVRQKILTENISLPTEDGEEITIYFDKTMVEKGGITSPYGREYTVLPDAQRDNEDIEELNEEFETAVSGVFVSCNFDEDDKCQYEYTVFLSDGVRATMDEGGCFPPYLGTLESDLGPEKVLALENCPV